MALDDNQVLEIKALAKQARLDIVRMVHAAGSGHPGGPMGMADFMSVLFHSHFNLTTENKLDPGRDRLVLGNGHTCAGYYSQLAAKGLVDSAELMNLRKFGSDLQGHPHRNLDLGIDFSTGSLGNSLSVSLGMALGARLSGWDSRIYSISSDGESQEGQIWEAATAASHYDAGNLTVLVDFNNIQIDGHMRQVMDVLDLRLKYEAFGWHAVDVDGHDLRAIDEALVEARQVEDRPSAIVCHTVLGKGVSFMEDQPGWHGVAPGDDELAQAIAELESIPVEVV